MKLSGETDIEGEKKKKRERVRKRGEKNDASLGFDPIYFCPPSNTVTTGPRSPYMIHGKIGFLTLS